MNLRYNRETPNTEKLLKIWEQIADRFKDFPQNLIFEGQNEPRITDDSSIEWWGNNEGYEVLNRLNSKFVDLVRRSGGRNNQRQLIIPTYAASIGSAPVQGFVMVNDQQTTVSVHRYAPYNLCLNESRDYNCCMTWDQNRDAPEIDQDYQRMKTTFLDKRISVIMGESGCIDKSNLNERVKACNYYYKKGREIGMPMFVWDDGGNFRLMDRRANPHRWVYPEMLDCFFNPQ